MRSLLLSLSAIALLSQSPVLLAQSMAATNMVAQNTPSSQKKTTPEHRAIVAAKPAPARNYKLSGSPAAPITLEVYTDYECPSCRVLYMQTLPDLQTQYVATGKVQLLHRDFPLPQHNFSKVAARWANAAGQMGKYEIVANQIFKTQGDWSQNGNIEAQVAKVVDAGDVAKLREMVKSDTHLDDTVTADVAQGNRDALNQTPTMVIVAKGKRQKIDGVVPFPILKSYIDQLLAK